MSYEEMHLTLEEKKRVFYANWHAKLSYCESALILYFMAGFVLFYQIYKKREVTFPLRKVSWIRKSSIAKTHERIN